MSAAQGVVLVAVAIAGTVVVLTRQPFRQVLSAGIYGLLLAALFMLFQAPDVALSQIAVGTIALPAMLLLTLRKIAERDEEEED
jgi:uncharacterized MnhB-related membrane protein